MSWDRNQEVTPRRPGRVAEPLRGLLMWFQRRGWRVPRAIRTPMRRLAVFVETRGVHKRSPIDDWSRPLIGEYPGDPPKAEDHAVVDSLGSDVRGAPNGPRAVGPELRCLISTGVLDVGGEDEMVAFLARRLPPFGVDVTVMHVGTSINGHSGSTGRLAAALNDEGVRVVDVADRDGAHWIAQQRFDVISAHGAPSWVLDCAVSNGIPYVETLHGFHRFFDADWSAEARRSVGIARLIAVSELVRRQYLAHNPSCGPDKIITIPNGVDDNHRPAVNRDKARAWLGLDEEYLFVSLARYCVQKNPYGLLAAFAEVAESRRHAHLLISGRADDRSYAEQVRRYRDRLTPPGRVHLREHSPYPAALLAAADGFVLDSFFEGWSLASMEALFLGVPVVLSEVGGSAEQVGDSGERGYLIPNPLGDPMAIDWPTMSRARFQPQSNREALVSALRTMVDERDRWAVARSRIRRDATRLFRADECVRAHAETLIQAAGRGAQSAERELAMAPE